MIISRSWKLPRTQMIPTDIADHVLSILHSDQDYPTLEFIRRSTSCRSLPLLSITFCRLPDSTQLEWAKGTYALDPTKFSHILNDRPHIMNHVREVGIIFAGSGFLQSSLPVISSILPKLSRIESITLETNPPLSWSTLDPEFRTALRNSIRSPTVKGVGMSNINAFPLDTFDLGYLQFYGQFTDSGGPSMPPYPPLCSLRVDSQLKSTRVVSWMQSNTLQNLSI